MKQEVMIYIKSLIETNGEQQCIELNTRGKLLYKDGTCFLSYKETEQSGYDGCTVLIKSESEDKVTISRSGDAGSQLFIERGKRNVCGYGTPYGAIMLGVSGGTMKRSLDSRGLGELSFGYELDVNSELFGKNQLFIKIRECTN